jgi:hypothetical protein
MTMSIEQLWRMSDVELLSAYYDTRRQYIEKKFIRDTQRARLEWIKAKAFVASSGRVTERRTAVDTLDDVSRKGQELREQTRDLELLKTDLDVIVMIVRLRGASLPPDAASDEAAPDEPGEESA